MNVPPAILMRLEDEGVGQWAVGRNDLLIELAEGHGLSRLGNRSEHHLKRAFFIRPQNVTAVDALLTVVFYGLALQLAKVSSHDVERAQVQ